MTLEGVTWHDVARLLDTLDRIASAMEKPRREPIFFMVPESFRPEQAKEMADMVRKALNE